MSIHSNFNVVLDADTSRVSVILAKVVLQSISDIRYASSLPADITRTLSFRKNLRKFFKIICDYVHNNLYYDEWCPAVTEYVRKQ